MNRRAAGRASPAILGLFLATTGFAQEIYPGSVSPMGATMYGINTGQGAAGFLTVPEGITALVSTGRELQFQFAYDASVLGSAQVEDLARQVCSRFSLISIDLTHSAGALDFQCLR